ncbi:hypothetical protein NC653_019816 [Populus alba x Populus x berolinensis]|uniref:Uncharacterized protein n=1 Tax=Populus alba x Populus x berolinensis TaxID=444605 RepID=A0AAD6MJ31_9ROSI|nr:hypothetical protein NC653_019816 [Populus alba x Populus x berolinensis]
MEDLENMIDEYDRTKQQQRSESHRDCGSFLFPLKPESSHSIGPILENSVKSEDWFLNALKWICRRRREGWLLLVVVVETGEGSNKGVVKQDVHSVLDFPMLETTSSFGSTSSSPSLANLPPIRVHVEDGGGEAQDERICGSSHRRRRCLFSIAVSSVLVGGQVVVESRRSHSLGTDADFDLPESTEVQAAAAGGAAIDLPFSRFSFNEPNLCKSHLEQNRVAANPVDSKINAFSDDPNTRVQIHQTGSGILVMYCNNQFDQTATASASATTASATTATASATAAATASATATATATTTATTKTNSKLIHAGAHYIQHHPTGAVAHVGISILYTLPSCCCVDISTNTSFSLTWIRNNTLLLLCADKATQAYNLLVQPTSISEYRQTTIPSSRNQTPPNPNMAPSYHFQSHEELLTL